MLHRAAWNRYDAPSSRLESLPGSRSIQDSATDEPGVTAGRWHVVGEKPNRFGASQAGSYRPPVASRVAILEIEGSSVFHVTGLVIANVPDTLTGNCGGEPGIACRT